MEMVERHRRLDRIALEARDIRARLAELDAEAQKLVRRMEALDEEEQEIRSLGKGA